MSDQARNPTAQKIIDAADTRARDGGYDAFSFREIAKELDIKSASVHYHFPTKADLGTAVVAEAIDRLLANLPASADPNQPADALLAAFVTAYRRMVDEEALGSLPGIFAAQSGRLPLEVAAATRDALARLGDWLTPLFARRGAARPRDTAFAFLAHLEGAVMLARIFGSTALFDDIAARALRR